MKLKFTFLILITIALVSCKKTTNVDVTVSNSGKLTYKLLDDAGKGLPNIKVLLYDNLNEYYNTSVLLDTRTTDQNGSVDFGELNPATYLVVPDSPMVNNVKYSFKEYLQVVGGSTKQKETKVSDYSGTLNIHAFTYYYSSTSTPLKNMGVLIVPASSYSNSNNVTRNISVADFKGVTNDLGNVSFKVPSTKQYIAVLYNTTSNVLLSYSSVPPIEKGAIVDIYLYSYQY